MGNDWETVCIDDLKSPEKYSCVGGPFGSSLSRKHYVDSGIPVIRGVNLSDDSFSESDFVFVSTEKALELQRNMAFRGDLVFTQRGTLGQVALIPDDSNYERYIVSQSQMKLTINSEIADPYFLYSYFRTKEAKTLIEKSAIVGGVPHINLGILKEFKLKLPPLRVQKQVANISRLLDNKIHLNRQINQTLEQMAQALFKSWFVDFDPVVDNALDAGFFAEHSDLPEALLRRAEQRKIVRQHPDFKPLAAETRQLFPATFEACDEPSLGLGGWVPKGWSGRSVSKAITVNPKVKLTKGEMAAFVDMKSLPVTGYSIEDVDRKAFSGGAKFKQHDVLFARITPCLQNGKTGFVDFLSDGESGFGSTEFIVLRGNEFVDCTYVACLARDEKFRQHAMQSMVGSSGRQRVQNSCFDDYFIVIPPQNIMNKFSGIVSTSFKKLKTNSDEIISLANIRDTLLPKLIAGELRLKDNDPVVGADNND